MFTPIERIVTIKISSLLNYAKITKFSVVDVTTGKILFRRKANEPLEKKFEVLTSSSTIRVEYNATNSDEHFTGYKTIHPREKTNVTVYPPLSKSIKWILTCKWFRLKLEAYLIKKNYNSITA